jgi:hypothetical protein
MTASKVTLIVIRNNNEEDRINVYEDETHREMFRLTYKSADTSKTLKEFYMSERRALNYISDILESLTHDVDPFEHLQVLSDIHPSVMYHVMDLDDEDIRTEIENIVSDAMLTSVDTVNLRR